MRVDSFAMTEPNDSRRRALPSSPLGLWLIIFFILAWKAQDSLMSPQFWAEDAFIFFKEQLSARHPLVFQPYAGYLHAVPRLGAWLASAISLERQPLAYNLMAAAVNTAAIGFCIHRLSRYMPWVILLAAFVLTPNSGEIIGSLTNVHWFMQIALAVICLDRRRPASLAVTCLRVASVLLMGLSGPFSIFTLVVVVGGLGVSWGVARVAHPQTASAARFYLATRDKAVLVSLASAAVIQVLVLATHPLPASVDAPAASGVGHLLRMALVAVIELGPIHTFGESVVPSKLWFVIEALMLVSIVRGRLDIRHKIILLSLLAVAVIEITSAAYVRPFEPLRNFGSGDRYFYMFKVLFWLAAWSACAGTVKHRNRREVTATILIAMGIVIAAKPDLLRRQPLQDLDWKMHAQELTTPGEHVIPINPLPWTMTISTDANGKMQ